MPSRNDSHSEYLRDIQAQIRAEAEQLRKRGPLPRAPAPSAISPDESSTTDIETSGINRDLTDYSLADLTGEHFITFIQHAYRQILKREPDEPGAHNQLQQLAVGTSKVEILGNLRYSPEGRKIGVRVRGLRWRFLLAKACRVPVIGKLLAWSLALLALPQLMRHQYAQENYFAAKHLASSDRAERQEQHFAELQRAAADAQRDVVSLEVKLIALESRPAPAPPPEPDPTPEPETHASDHALLLHEIHALKHWLFSLQHTLDEVEQLTRDELLLKQQQAWELSTSPAYQRLQSELFTPWLGALTAQLGNSTIALDLAGPAPWLCSMREAGLDASGVTARELWQRHMRTMGMPVMLAEPLQHLATLADASLDALTATTLAATLESDTPQDLITQVQRVLKPGGWLLLGWLTDALQQLRGDAHVADPDLISLLLRQAGFEDISRVDASDGTPALLAQRSV